MQYIHESRTFDMFIFLQSAVHCSSRACASRSWVDRLARSPRCALSCASACSRSRSKAARNSVTSATKRQLLGRLRRYNSIKRAWNGIQLSYSYRSASTASATLRGIQNLATCSVPRTQIYLHMVIAVDPVEDAFPTVPVAIDVDCCADMLPRRISMSNRLPLAWIFRQRHRIDERPAKVLSVSNTFCQADFPPGCSKILPPRCKVKTVRKSISGLKVMLACLLIYQVVHDGHKHRRILHDQHVHQRHKAING